MRDGVHSVSGGGAAGLRKDGPGPSEGGENHVPAQKKGVSLFSGDALGTSV